MKNFYLAALLVSMCFSASAQEYKARAPKAIEERRVAGVQNYIQDEFYRLNRIVVIETNKQPIFTITSTLGLVVVGVSVGAAPPTTPICFPWFL